MNEAEVVSIICDHLQIQNWHFWIDDHPIHKNLTFRKHSIIIGGSRPDIFGLNTFNQIFAIEVKGIEDYKKAIGQALTYKSGVNLSYIGGLTSRLDSIKDIALSSGLGLMFVNESDKKVEKIQDPMYSVNPYFLEDIKNELSVLQNQKKEVRSFASFGRTHLLNYFSPIFLFQEESVRTKEELIHAFKSINWKNKTYPEFISGANAIGLIDIEENGYTLSKIGQFCLDYFKTLDIDSLDILQETLEKTSRTTPVYTKIPHLAKFLQLIYFQNPDFKKFVSILLSFYKKEISFKEILTKVITEYPNLFLNFFIVPKERERVLNLYLKGKKDDLIANLSRTTKNFGLYNLIFAFKRHLVHLGILTKENTTFYGKKEAYNAEEDIWIIGDDVLI